MIMRTDNALALISKHKQLIIVVIGVAAIASYMVPFANLFAVADAWSDNHKKVDFKKKKFDFKFAKFFKKIFKFKDSTTTITNSFNNFGLRNFEFERINSIDVYAGGTTTPTGGSIALNQGSNYFIFIVNNCPGGTTGGSCSVNAPINIQTNNYAVFGGSV
jgi:hypothetical protein